MSSDLIKVLEKVKKQVREKYGEDVVISPDKLEETLHAYVEHWISLPISENVSLDPVVGVPGKGLPTGKAIELFGEESHGKTSLLYFILGKIQASGGIVGLIDSESSYDEDWATKLGMDSSGLFLFPPNDESCLEYNLNLIQDTVLGLRKDLPEIPIVFGYDTLYAGMTKEDRKKTDFLEKDRLGILARALTVCLPPFHYFLTKHQVTVIFINQLRDNVGVIYGKATKTPGGRAIKHWASVRINVKRRKADLKFGWINSIAQNEKNKLAPPFQSVDFRISGKNGLTEIPVKGRPKK